MVNVATCGVHAILSAVGGDWIEAAAWLCATLGWIAAVSEDG